MLGVTTTLRARPRLPDARAFANGTSKHGWLLTASAAGAAALLAKPAYTSARQLRRHLLQRSSKRRRRWLNPAAADAICGAVGEVAQLVMLYPMDTVKVLCQAHGTGVRDVVGCLRARQLGPLRLLATMYAGCGAAAACSVVIGAAYLVSFYHIQRAIARAVATRPRLGSHGLPQGRPGTEVAPCCAPGEAGGCTSARVDVAAACAASVATSLLEGPVEMFRHRMQARAALRAITLCAPAGLMQGRMMANMAAAAQVGGVGCLYHGYLAFLAKSLPYDVAELFTYSQLSALGGPLTALPAGCRDMLFGACAGTAAVLTSMPADCVKTQIELAAVAAPGGLVPDLAVFAGTARGMVRRGGVGALFRGMGPRMADKVPGTMVYWLAVESCRRALDPYVQPALEDESASSTSKYEAVSPAPLAA